MQSVLARGGQDYLGMLVIRGPHLQLLVCVARQVQQHAVDLLSMVPDFCWRHKVEKPLHLRMSGIVLVSTPWLAPGRSYVVDKRRPKTACGFAYHAHQCTRISAAVPFSVGMGKPDSVYVLQQCDSLGDQLC
jgi:hypothetical protein